MRVWRQTARGFASEPPRPSAHLSLSGDCASELDPRGLSTNDDLRARADMVPTSEFEPHNLLFRAAGQPAARFFGSEIESHENPIYEVVKRI
jgi:hypothetical protein